MARRASAQGKPTRTRIGGRFAPGVSGNLSGLKKPQSNDGGGGNGRRESLAQAVAALQSETVAALRKSLKAEKQTAIRSIAMRLLIDASTGSNPAAEKVGQLLERAELEHGVGADVVPLSIESDADAEKTLRQVSRLFNFRQSANELAELTPEKFQTYIEKEVSDLREHLENERDAILRQLADAEQREQVEADNEALDAQVANAEARGDDGAEIVRRNPFADPGMWERRDDARI